MELTTILYRPVGPKELRRIADSGYHAFPIRLPGEPIFYPVLNEEYATKIARDWNAQNPSQKKGYMAKFSVRTEFLSKYEIRTVGGRVHQEYWIPGGDLQEI
jgi:hypothetical protein